MNRTQASTQRTTGAAQEGGEFFNLHASGCGYLSRVRWVTPKSKGRKAEPFLACAINALRGNTDDPAYTYFDLKVSGQEALEIVEQLMPAVNEDRKVFVAFKAGDFYAHAYERKMKDDQGRQTNEVEHTALIKGRLLLITHAKVDGETVYQREDSEGGTGETPQSPSMSQGAVKRTDDNDGNGSADASNRAGGDVDGELATPPARQQASAPAPQRGTDRTRVRSYGREPEAAHA